VELNDAKATQPKKKSARCELSGGRERDGGFHSLWVRRIRKLLLDYIAELTGQYGARSNDDRREILRWILYDNHKFTSYIATLRFMLQFTTGPEPAVAEFLKQRVTANLKIVNGHLATRDFILGGRATIADVSMCGYMFFDGELGVSLESHPHIGSWLERIKNLPRWKHPYSLLPRTYVR
jgi:glutathione S-transferase